MRASIYPVLAQVPRHVASSQCGSHWRAAGQGESLLMGLTVLGIAYLLTGWRNLKLTIFLSPELGIKKMCSFPNRHALAYFHDTKNPNIFFSIPFLLGHHISFSSGS